MQQAHNKTGTPSQSDDCRPPVRNASPHDIPALGALLGHSLADDPLLRWIYPENRQRTQLVIRYFTRLLKPRIRGGIVTTVDRKSVAVWIPPNPPPQSLWERYSESYHMRRAHGRRVHEIRNCFQKMAERHPPSPHWYLLALATDNACRGQGHAGRLLEEMFLRCDQESQRIALETSEESNLAFYQKFGFVVTNELLVDTGVKTWLMCREAQSR